MKKLVLFLIMLSVFSAVVFAAEKSVSGIVVNSAGNPVAGIAVYLIESIEFPAQKSRLLAKTETDTNGKFSFLDQEIKTDDSKEVKLFVYQPGKLMGWYFIYAPCFPMLTEIYISVYPVSSKTGFVTDDNGKPLEGVQVSAGSMLNKSTYFDQQFDASILTGIVELPKAITNKDGKFIMPDTPEIVSEFNVSKSGYAKQEIESDSNTYFTPKKIKMVQCGSMKGKAVEPNGKSAEIRINIVNSETANYYCAATSKDGSFEIKDIVPGDYQIKYSSISPDSDMPFAIDEVKVAAGETTDIGIIKEKSTTILSGILLDSNNKPLSGYRICAAGNSIAYTTTDINGKYEMQVIAGEICVSVTSSDQLISFIESSKLYVSAIGLTNHIVKLPAFKVVYGTVIDQENKPVIGAIVSGECHYFTKSDKDGKFELSLSSNHPRFSDASNASIEINAMYGSKLGISIDTNMKDILKKKFILKLKEIKPINILVTDDTGKPFEGASVMHVPWQPYRTNKEGKVTISSVPSGSESSLLLIAPYSREGNSSNNKIIIDSNHSKPIYTFTLNKTEIY